MTPAPLGGSGGNNLSLNCTISRANVTLKPHEFESLAIEFYGSVLTGIGPDADNEYIVEFTSASDMAQFKVALRSFAR